MRALISSYPRVRVQGDGRQVVSQAGAVLLVETARKIGLEQAIAARLASWRKPRAVHDPGKALVDLALAVALGGDCLANVAMLRCEPSVFGPVASDAACHVRWAYHHALGWSERSFFSAARRRDAGSTALITLARGARRLIALPRPAT